MRLSPILIAVYFLVSWDVKTWENKACENSSYIDPYTGQDSGIVYAVACGEWKSYKMDKKFDSLDEAKKFVERAPSSTSNFKIESINTEEVK